MPLQTIKTSGGLRCDRLQQLHSFIYFFILQTLIKHIKQARHLAEERRCKEDQALARWSFPSQSGGRDGQTDRWVNHKRCQDCLI